jgi:hypothetical protein
MKNHMHDNLLDFQLKTDFAEKVSPYVRLAE